MKHEMVLNTAKAYLILGGEHEKNGMSGLYYFAKYNECMRLYRTLKKFYENQASGKKAA